MMTTFIAGNSWQLKFLVKLHSRLALEPGAYCLNRSSSLVAIVGYDGVTYILTDDAKRASNPDLLDPSIWMYRICSIDELVRCKVAADDACVGLKPIINSHLLADEWYDLQARGIAEREHALNSQKARECPCLN